MGGVVKKDRVAGEGECRNREEQNLGAPTLMGGRFFSTGASVKVTYMCGVLII